MTLNPNVDERSLWIYNAKILLPNGDFLQGEVRVNADKIHQVASKVGPLPEGIRSMQMAYWCCQE